MASLGTPSRTEAARVGVLARSMSPSSRATTTSPWRLTSDAAAGHRTNSPASEGTVPASRRRIRTSVPSGPGDDLQLVDVGLDDRQSPPAHIATRFPPRTPVTDPDLHAPVHDGRVHLEVRSQRAAGVADGVGAGLAAGGEDFVGLGLGCSGLDEPPAQGRPQRRQDPGLGGHPEVQPLVQSHDLHRQEGDVVVVRGVAENAAHDVRTEGLRLGGPVRWRLGATGRVPPRATSPDPPPDPSV